MRIGALLLLLLQVLFAPLDYADVPDQTWLGGLWNGGDYDDAIFQFESTGGTIEPFVLPIHGRILIVHGFIAALPETVVIAVTISADQTRAPPTT